MRGSHKKTGKLYGIGIGPGDPKLLTLRAKEILDTVDVIFIPKGKNVGSSCARTIIEKVVPRKDIFTELTFPMTKNEIVLKQSWRGAAGRIAREIRGGKEAAFVTLGDPFIYSTYIYLLRTLVNDFPDIDFESVPGITSFNAAASRIQQPLAEGNERLVILPVTDSLRGLRKAFREFDTVVLMKVGSRLGKVIHLLRKTNLLQDSLLISRVGQPNEKVITDLSAITGKKWGYFSVIIVKSKKRA